MEPYLGFKLDEQIYYTPIYVEQGSCYLLDHQFHFQILAESSPFLEIQVWDFRKQGPKPELLGVANLNYQNFSQEFTEVPLYGLAGHTLGELTLRVQKKQPLGAPLRSHLSPFKTKKMVKQIGPRPQYLSPQTRPVVQRKIWPPEAALRLPHK